MRIIFLADYYSINLSLVLMLRVRQDASSEIIILSAKLFKLLIKYLYRRSQHKNIIMKN